MKISTKILTSIPSILSLLILFDMFTFDFVWRIFYSMKAYYLQLALIFILMVIAWVYLIRKLWLYKNIEKSEKTLWTFIILFAFSQITTLYYIWIKDKKLMKQNNGIRIEES